MIKKIFLATLMEEDRVVYFLYVFRGHVFREWLDGHLDAADEWDLSFVESYKKRNPELFQEGGEEK